MVGGAHFPENSFSIPLIERFRRGPMKVIYENWKGIERERSIEVEYLHFGSTKHHTAQQWLLRCTDLETNEIHDFSLAKVKKMDVNQLRFRSAI
ncbi:hypothetical protein D3C85_1485630 [compost metagenome]